MQISPAVFFSLSTHLTGRGWKTPPENTGSHAGLPRWLREKDEHKLTNYSSSESLGISVCCHTARMNADRRSP